MRRRLSGLVAGGVALVALALVSGPAQAQSGYGTVDVNRIEREYKGMAQIKSEFDAYVQEQQAKLTARQKVMMLPDADYTQYFDLQSAAAPTEANKQKIAQLESQADQRDKRFQELARLESAARTPEQQKEFEELNKVFTARKAELQKLGEDLDKQVSAKGESLMQQANSTIEAAVKAVAEQKKFSAVFVKAALLYGGTDITEEVITKLNGAASTAAPAR